jgi:hypothetical protein
MKRLLLCLAPLVFLALAPAGSYAWHPAGYWLKDGYPYYGEPRPAAAYPEAPCHKPDAGNALAAEVLLRLLQAQNPLSPPVTQTPLAAPPQLTAQEIAAVRQAIYSQQQAQAQFQQQQLRALLLASAEALQKDFPKRPLTDGIAEEVRRLLTANRLNRLYDHLRLSGVILP